MHVFRPIDWFFQHTYWVSVLLILILGLLLRVGFVAWIPYGLNSDESAYGYNAYTLMQTGQDEWGAYYPLFLKSFGEYKPALLSYSIIPVFHLFGVTDFAVRVTAVFWGMVSLLAWFGVFYRLYDRRWHAVIALAVAVLLPWHIHYSRQVTDPIISFAFLGLGVFGLLASSSWARTLGAISLMVSMYTYNSARLFVPLFLLIIAGLTYRQNIIWLWKRYKYPLVMFTIGTLWIWQQQLFGPAGTRARDVLFFHQSAIVDAVNNSIYRSIGQGWGPMRVLHNKGIESVYEWAQRYGAHFQYDFLFAENNIDSHNAFDQHGNVLLVFLPLLVIGFIGVVRRFNNRDWAVLMWLLLAPVASSFAVEYPHSGRALIMLPAIVYLITHGCIWVYHSLSWFWLRRLATIGIMVAVGFNVSLYITDYYLFYPEETEFEWQGFYKIITRDVYAQRHRYDRVFFSDGYYQPYIFFAWYNRLTPSVAQKRVDHGRPTKQFENIAFRGIVAKDVLCMLQKNRRTLVVATADVEQPSQVEPSKTYYFLSRYGAQKPSFYLYDGLQLNPNEEAVIKAEKCRVT